MSFWCIELLFDWVEIKKFTWNGNIDFGLEFIEDHVGPIAMPETKFNSITVAPLSSAQWREKLDGTFLVPLPRGPLYSANSSGSWQLDTAILP